MKPIILFEIISIQTNPSEFFHTTAMLIHNGSVYQIVVFGWKEGYEKMREN
mgnify:CR=1 FL=1